MTDPYTIHASLACPSCRVVGKVIRFERESEDWHCGSCDSESVDDIDPYVCVECGQRWADMGAETGAELKQLRVEWMRVHEGRPYEPPKLKPVERRKGYMMIGHDGAAWPTTSCSWFDVKSVDDVSYLSEIVDKAKAEWAEFPDVTVEYKDGYVTITNVKK